MVTGLKLSEHIRRNRNLGIVDVGIGPLQKKGKRVCQTNYKWLPHLRTLALRTGQIRQLLRSKG